MKAYQKPHAGLAKCTSCDRIGAYKFGVCIQCRKKNCTNCNLPFAPVNPHAKICYDCRNHKRKHDSLPKYANKVRERDAGPRFSSVEHPTKQPV